LMSLSEESKRNGYFTYSGGVADVFAKQIYR
jgi:hypothetical protein